MTIIQIIYIIYYSVELNNAIEQIKLLKQELNELSAEEKRLHKVILVKTI